MIPSAPLPLRHILVMLRGVLAAHRDAGAASATIDERHVRALVEALPRAEKPSTARVVPIDLLEALVKAIEAVPAQPVVGAP